MFVRPSAIFDETGRFNPKFNDLNPRRQVKRVPRRQVKRNYVY